MRAADITRLVPILERLARMHEAYERVVTYSEMARILGLSQRTLERWVREKRFSYGVLHGPGGGKRYTRFNPRQIKEQLEVDAYRRARL